ncbi:hypothetical protein IAT38_006212 [Cryptococcus sp. DSM 104549]
MAEWEAEAERRRLRRAQLQAELREIEEQEARDLARRTEASSQVNVSNGAPSVSSALPLSPHVNRKGPTWNTGPSAALVAPARPPPPSNPPPVPNPPPPLQPPSASSSSRAALAQKGLARLASFIPQFRVYANTRPIPSKDQCSNYLVHLQGDPEGLDTPYMIAGRRFDVYALFCVVVRLGGHLQVTRYALWAPIAGWLGFPTDVTTTPGELSHFYAKKLGVLEDIWDKEVVEGPGAGKAIWFKARDDLSSTSAQGSLSQPPGDQPSSSRASPLYYYRPGNWGSSSNQQSQPNTPPSAQTAPSSSRATTKELFPTLSMPHYPFSPGPQPSGSGVISIRSQQGTPANGTSVPANATVNGTVIANGGHSSSSSSGAVAVSPASEKKKGKGKGNGGKKEKGRGKETEKEKEQTTPKTGQGKGKAPEAGKDVALKVAQERSKVEEAVEEAKVQRAEKEGSAIVAPVRQLAVPPPSHPPSHPPAHRPAHSPAHPPAHSPAHPPAHRPIAPSPSSSKGKGKARDFPSDTSSDSDDPLLISPQVARMELEKKRSGGSSASVGADAGVGASTGGSARAGATNGAGVVNGVRRVSESPVKTALAGRSMLGGADWSERKRKRLSVVFDLPAQEPETPSGSPLVRPGNATPSGSTLAGAVRPTPDVPPPSKRPRSPLLPSVKQERPALTPPASASTFRQHRLPSEAASSHASDTTTGSKRRKRVIHIGSRGSVDSIAGASTNGLGGSLPMLAEAAPSASLLDEAASQELSELRHQDVLPGSQFSIAAGSSPLSQPSEKDDVGENEEQSAEQGEGKWREAYPDMDEETRKLWDIEIVLSRSPTPEAEDPPPAPAVNGALQAVPPEKPVQAEADIAIASGESGGEQVERSEDEVAELIEQVDKSSKVPQTGLFAVVLPISNARRAWLIKKGIYNFAQHDYIEAVGSASSIDQPASPVPPTGAGIHLSLLSRPITKPSPSPPTTSSRSAHKYILPSSGPSRAVRVRSPSPLPRRFVARGGPTLPEPYPSILNPETLLDRCTPRECTWHDCDAVMACESRLAMHVEKHAASDAPGLGKVQVAVTKFVFEKYKGESTRTEAVPGEWLYRCLWRDCDEPCFVSEKKLRQHIMGKHVSRVLMCPFQDCTRTSPTIAHLTRHVIKMHDDYTSVPRPLIFDIRPSIHPLPPLPVTVPVSLLTTPPVTPAPRTSSYYTQRVIHKVRDMCFTGDDPVLKGWLVEEEGEGVKMKRMMEVVEPESETPMSLLAARAEEVEGAQKSEGSGSGAAKQVAKVVHSQSSTTFTNVNEHGHGRSPEKKRQTVVVELPSRSQSNRTL